MEFIRLDLKGTWKGTEHVSSFGMIDEGGKYESGISCYNLRDKRYAEGGNNMNIVEMYELCKKIYNENTDKYDYIGLRFEDKERTIGETCEYSRNNVDREDERDFPEYGTDEYFEMEELDGTSSWDMSQKDTYDIPRYWDKEKECSRFFLSSHCYVIAGNRLGHTSNTVIDVNEIVIKDAVVIAQIF